jgi:putative ABC transport system permease protein
MLAIVQAADFQKLPFKNADQLVSLSRREAPGSDCPDCRHRLSAALFLEWRERARSFSEFEASEWRPRELRTGDDRQSLDGRAATIGFLPMLSVAPFIGRGFVTGDTVAGAPLVALLSYPFWQARFGGDSGIVGKSIQLADANQRPAPVPAAYTVIGVLPANFVFDGRAKVWTPLDLRAELAASIQRRSLDPVARLLPGRSVRLADAELRVIDSRIETGRSAGPRDIGMAEPLRRAWTAELKPAEERFALLGVAGVVLFLATLNVAGLALARAFKRRVELAVRGALGASRSRLVCQLAVEMSVVSMAGGLLALLLTRLTIRAVSAHFYLDLLGLSATVNYPLVATVLLLVLAIGIGTGVLASGQLGVDLAATLRRATTLGVARGTGRLRQVLIAGEMALALIILASAGLMGKELARIITTEIGFDPRNLMTILVRRAASETMTPDPPQARLLSQAAVERFATVPGVVDASAASTDLTGISRVQPGGKQIGERDPLVLQDIWPNYFKTMGLPLVSGRRFSRDDGGGTDPVVIVSRRAASRFWPGLNPLGQRVTLGKPGAEESATVVGVVGDYEVDGYTPPLRILFFYRPIAQGRPTGIRAVLRLRTTDSATIGAIRRATVDLRGDAVGVEEIAAMQRWVDAGLAGPRFNTTALVALATFSLFLAVIGVYGIVASTVAERTREIGIRMALGATQRVVLRHVSRHAAGVIAVGTAAGIVGAFATTRVLKSMLYGTSPTDPLVFVGAALVLALAALVATYIPARRAARLDPMVALRSE